MSKESREGPRGELINKMGRLFCLVIGFQFVLSLTNANPTIDSLEVLLEKAEPGWDQIDYAVGLARLYAGGQIDQENSQRLVDLIYKNAEEQKIPEARAYGLIMENLIAYNIENDVAKRERVLIEALDIAKKYKCNDAIIFAGYQLSETYWVNKGDFVRAKEVAESILPYIDETVDFKHIANFKRTIGYVYTRTGQPEEGFQYMLEAVELLEEMKVEPYIDPRIDRVSAQYGDLDNLIQFALNAIGESKLRLGSPEESRQFQQKALEKAELSGRPFIIGWQHERIGLHFEQRGYYEEALDHFQKSRELIESYGSPGRVYRSDIHLARVMMQLRDFESGLEYGNRAFQYFESAHDSLYMFNAAWVNAKIYMHREDTERADSVIVRIDALVTATPNPETLGKYHQLLGERRSLESDSKSAIRQYEESLRNYNESKNNLGLVEIYPLLANEYLKLGNPKAAFEFGEKALEYARNQSNVAFTRQAYLILSRVYESLNKPNQSLDYYKQYVAYNDSVFTADTQVKLKEEQVRRDVEGIKIEREKAKAEADELAAINQVYLIGGVVILLILVLVAYLAFNLGKVKRKLESQNEELSNLNKTKDKFFGIIAHDLRSPLLGLEHVGEEINYQLEKGRPEELREVSDEVEQTTKQLSGLLDNLLNWALMQDGMIPLHPEQVNVAESVSTVFGLMASLAKMKGIELESAIGEGSEVFADSKAFDTILRNLISNALKFTAEGGKVYVRSHIEVDKVRVEVSDTGSGMTKDKLKGIFDLDKKSERGTMGEKGVGLGLILCKELVEQNGGSIFAESEVGQGSKFTFVLPKKNV